MNIFKSILILGLASTPAISAEVSICIENEAYPPLINGTNSLPSDNPGHSIRVAKIAAQRAGITLKFVRRPWARCLQMVNQGKTNGLLPSIKTNERNQMYAFPSNNELFLNKAQYHIFYSAKDKRKHFYEALANSKDKPITVTPELKYGIAAPYGYIAYAQLKRLNLLSNHDYTLEQGLQMVAKGKLDGYVVIKSIGEQRAKELGVYDKIKVTDSVFLQERLYVVFNNRFYTNNQNKIDEFWRQLPDIRLEILDH